MKKAVSIAIIIFTITSCDFTSSKEYLKQAWALEDQQKYHQAIILLNKAIDKDPSFIEAYLSRGADKSALKDFKGAIHDYSEVIKIDPKNTLALFNIGNNYKRLNSNLTALQYYNKAFKSKGGDQVYIDLVPNEFDKSSNSDVHGYEIAYERGLAYLNLDSLKSSFKDFHNCVNSGYQAKESYYWMGIIAKAYNKKPLACRCFLKSQQLGDSDATIEYKNYCDTTP